MIDPEGAIDVAAQIYNDNIKFPIVVLSRSDNTNIDTNRYNFTYAKKGVIAGFDSKTNTLYSEKIIPVKLDYSLNVLTTNIADTDEIVKELLFKYSDMYFLNIDTPYEVSRKIRFGIRIDKDQEIHTESGTFDYISGGKLYETVIQLHCEGCVLVSYNPMHLRRFDTDIEVK